MGLRGFVDGVVDQEFTHKRQEDFVSGFLMDGVDAKIAQGFFAVEGDDNGHVEAVNRDGTL